jgi:hypothetical protein
MAPPIGFEPLEAMKMLMLPLAYNLKRVVKKFFGSAKEPSRWIFSR